MRGRAYVSCVLGLVCAAVAYADPPRLTVPQEVSGDPSAFVAVKATTDGKAVKFVALDVGLNVFPAGLLADSTATVVSASRAGRFRLLAYTGNADGPSDPAITVVVIGQAPPTPPGPGPGPQPEPDPEPDTSANPFTDPAPRVLIVYDPKATLTAAQHSTIYGKAARDALAAFAGETAGWEDFRIWTKDTVPAGEPAVWKDAMSRARTSYPWVLIGSGRKGYEGPLPATEQEFLDLLTRSK